jgi:hypothetical protein
MGSVPVRSSSTQSNSRLGARGPGPMVHRAGLVRPQSASFWHIFARKEQRLQKDPLATSFSTQALQEHTQL